MGRSCLTMLHPTTLPSSWRRLLDPSSSGMRRWFTPAGRMCPESHAGCWSSVTPARCGEAMRILVLGGTRFVGRHIVNACLTRNDTVTLVHRGQTASPFIGLVRHIVSDRQTPTAEARTVLAEPWDAVIDTSASHID